MKNKENYIGSKNKWEGISSSIDLLFQKSVPLCKQKKCEDVVLKSSIKSEYQFTKKMWAEKKVSFFKMIWKNTRFSPVSM